MLVVGKSDVASGRITQRARCLGMQGTPHVSLYFKQINSSMTVVKIFAHLRLTSIGHMREPALYAFQHALHHTLELACCGIKSQPSGKKVKDL